MLYLRMFRAEVSKETLGAFGKIKSRLSARLQPLLRPALEGPAGVLGVPPDNLRRKPSARRESLEQGRTPTDGEIFTDGQTLIVVTLNEAPRRLSRRAITGQEEVTEAPYSLNVSAIGAAWDSETLAAVRAAVEEELTAPLAPFWYSSGRFNELKGEGREPASTPTAAELAASELLRDRSVRSLALAIKASGGLLVRDLPKQLAVDTRDRTEQLTTALREGRLIDSEIVVVCTKTQAQITRAPNREVLKELSAKGIKCACGKPLSDEKMEESVTITELSRTLLDKARWFTVLLVEELHRVGVAADAILVEQNVGGDEIDCLANVSGELTLFELKDKEFNLGSAYSFGAKIGIIRPQHPVIVSTECVGNDAKEHFVRARLAGGARDLDYTLFAPGEEPREIQYIEGVENLRTGIEHVVGTIYRKDAINLLNSVLPLAALDGRAVVNAVEALQPTNDLTPSQRRPRRDRKGG